jgi:hypothetical protein
VSGGTLLTAALGPGNPNKPKSIMHNGGGWNAWFGPPLPQRKVIWPNKANLYSSSTNKDTSIRSVLSILEEASERNRHERKELIPEEK